MALDSASVPVRPGAASPRCVLSVYGARPNLVKMAPVIEALRTRLPDARQVTVHTGQHYDHRMSDVFVEELGMPAPDHVLGVGSGSHGEQTARALERMEGVLVEERPDVVIVPGDVNSSLAAALAATKLGIPVAHVEAGLRSFDWTMPEEINRVLIDQLSRWCFTHSPEAADHLAREGIGADRVFPVGNTMIDTLLRMLPRTESSRIHADVGVVPGEYLLVTLHRPALVDGPLLAAALDRLEALSRTMPVVFPVHPRTRGRAAGFRPGADLHLIEPVGYLDFLALQRRAAAVITDSGGIQEETTCLGVRCFTLRENTERPITLTRGTNELLGLEVEALASVPARLDAAEPAPAPPDGWDGHAAARLADVLATTWVPASEPAPGP